MSRQLTKLFIDLTNNHKNQIFKKCFLYLRSVLALPYNHTRVYRIYRELELNLRIKPKHRIKRDKNQKLVVPANINQSQSMDFMHDTLTDGRAIRLFKVIDDYNREASTIQIDFSLSAQRIIRRFNQLLECRVKPNQIRCDNGPEYVSNDLKDWVTKKGIVIEYIEPGNSPEAWLYNYNHERSKIGNGGFTPIQKLSMAAQFYLFGVLNLEVFQADSSKLQLAIDSGSKGAIILMASAFAIPKVLTELFQKHNTIS